MAVLYLFRTQLNVYSPKYSIWLEVITTESSMIPHTLIYYIFWFVCLSVCICMCVCVFLCMSVCVLCVRTSSHHVRVCVCVHASSHHGQTIGPKRPKFKDVIQEVPGRTSLVEHSIPTGDASPIHLPPHRLAHSAQDFQREEMKTQLQQGIIEPSKSPWATIVIVPKKDGNKRMCVDFRKLNAATVEDDSYPLPYIEALINDIGMAKYIPTLDLTKGYHQVPVSKHSQERDHAFWADISPVDFPEADGSHTC